MQIYYYGKIIKFMDKIILLFVSGIVFSNSIIIFEPLSRMMVFEECFYTQLIVFINF